MMMAEETHEGLGTLEQELETRGLAGVTRAAPMMRKSDASRRVMGEQQIECARTTQPVYLIVRVVPPCIALKLL